MASLYNKKQYIENLRVFAMLSVVMIHVCTVGSTYYSEEDGVFLCRCLKNILHYAVPLFFMISGALLLDPAKKLTLEKFLKKYLLKYVCVILLFCWIFSLAQYAVDYGTIKPLYIVKSFIDVLQGEMGPLWIHMWYIYDLVGVMLLLPILRAAAEKLDKGFSVYFAIIGFIFISVVPILSEWTGSKFGITVKFGMYGFYMLIGYWIDNGYIRIKPLICAVCICVSVLLLPLNDYLRIYKGIQMNMEVYSSPLIVLYSASIYCLAKEKADVALPGIWAKLITFLSANSFGIYITHVTWLNIIYSVFKFDSFKYALIISLAGVWVVAVAASLLTTVILKRIPIVKSLV